MSSHVPTGSIAIYGDIDKATVLGMEVHLRGPVVGQIFLDIASRAFGRTSLVIVHSEIEAITTGNGMDMVRRFARVNDRVGTFVKEAAVALDNEGPTDWSSEGGNKAEKQRVHGVGEHGWRYS